MQNLMETYPYNLLVAILGSESEAEAASIPGLRQALTTLSERESDVLHRRYFDKQTLREVGQVFGVTQERVRQVEAKAIRKLRHPSRVYMMKTVSACELQKEREEHQKLRREHELLCKAFEVIAQKPAEPGVVVPMAELAVAMQTPIEDLDFSIRTHNCLRRAGKNSLGDVARMTEHELHNVRNLGRKSAEEVVKKLSEYGLELQGQNRKE